MEELAGGARMGREGKGKHLTAASRMEGNGVQGEHGQAGVGFRVGRCGVQAV